LVNASSNISGIRITLHSFFSEWLEGIELSPVDGYFLFPLG
jgi:hypothetical protein